MPGSDAEQNNTGSTTISSTVPFADLIPIIEASPTQGDVGRTIDIAWTVTNNVGNATGPTPADSWDDAIWLSRDVIAGNGDDVRLQTINHSGVLQVGQSYTDAESVTIPDNFIGSGFLFIQTDVQNTVFESQFEANNTTPLAAIEVRAPDLQVEASLSTFGGVFGDTIPVDFTVSNAGNGDSLTGTHDRIWLSQNPALGGGELLLATVSALETPLPSGGSYIQDDLLVNLPLDASLTEGSYYIIVQTDVFSAQPESNEGNNVGTTVATINLSFPPLPDLQLANASQVGPTPTSGQTVTIQWQTINEGTVPIGDSFSERIGVQNESTGQQILNTVVPLVVDATDPIEAGEVIARQLSFDLPDGPAGAGNIVVTILTDAQDDIVESFGTDTPETNNELSFTFTSTLPPYPDLIVDDQSATPAALQTGEESVISWSIENAGTAAVDTDFDQRIRVVRRSNGQTLFDGTVPYRIDDDGTIAVGASKTQSTIIRVPDGSGSVGDLDITITADSANQIFELNGSGDAETNNSAVTTVTTSLAPYPDLAASQVTAPAQTIADPASVTISWRVDNIGELAAQPGGWFDAVIASTDEIIGDGDDRVLGLFERTEMLAVGEFYTRAETFQLPPSYTGRYYLYVQTDKDGANFEDGRTANNYDRAGNFFDVMSIPYADLLVTEVTSDPLAFSGQPMEVSWRVENQGIGLSNRSTWNDTVYLATDPAGTNRIRTLGSFTHLGQLAVGNGYDPNGVGYVTPRPNRRTLHRHQNRRSGIRVHFYRQQRTGFRFV